MVEIGSNQIRSNQIRSSWIRLIICSNQIKSDLFKWDQIRSNWFKSVLIARIWGWGLDLHPALPFVFDYWEFWLMLVSLKSNHVLSNGSKSINCQHFHSVYIQDCNYIWFVSWNAGIKIDCPIFDLSILLYYYIARDLHNILTFHNQVTVRKTKIQKILFIMTEL